MNDRKIIVVSRDVVFAELTRGWGGKGIDVFDHQRELFEEKSSGEDVAETEAMGITHSPTNQHQAPDLDQQAEEAPEEELEQDLTMAKTYIQIWNKMKKRKKKLC